MESDNRSLIEIVKERVTSLAIVDSYNVVSAVEAQSANETLAKIKVWADDLEAARKASLAPLNDQIKTIRDRFRPAERILADAEATIKRALANFRLEEDRRLAAENAAREQAAAKQRAELQQQARLERERAEAKAKALADAGKTEKAEAVLAGAEASARTLEMTAISTVTERVAPTQLAGLNIRGVWKVKLAPGRNSLRTVLMALAEHQSFDPSQFVDLNYGAFNTLAKQMKDGVEREFPGLIAWEEPLVSKRT